MANAAKAMGALLVLLFTAWWTICVVEAGKELRILCQNFKKGVSVEDVIRTLKSGEFLEYEVATTEAPERISISSPWRFEGLRCEVELRESLVASTSLYEGFPIEQAAVWVAAVGLGAIALFQIGIAAGAPLGRFAWGGNHRVLPARLRAGSGAAALVVTLGIVSVLEAGGIAEGIVGPYVAGPLVWGLAAVIGLSVFGSAISKSTAEASLMTPVALVLFNATLAVALGT